MGFIDYRLKAKRVLGVYIIYRVDCKGCAGFRGSEATRSRV